MRLALVMAAVLALQPGTASAHTMPVKGYATWYRTGLHHAAAGPHLRHALRVRFGTWRGRWVSVCRQGTCVRVKITDWCACGPRHGRPTLIDLDRRDFARLASPSRGVLWVQVR